MLLPWAAGTVDLHQPERVWFRLRWGMTSLEKTCLFLLLSPVALAAPVSDTVNERIPVSGAELEAHWQVDCTEVLDQLSTAAQSLKAGDICPVGPALRHQLQLCVFIYQPPGSGAGRDCPDYRGALSVLNLSGPEVQCPDLAELLQLQADCPAASPGD
jgi:hypothetical protein